MRLPLALLLLTTLTGPARVQPDEPFRPTAEERAWLAQCLGSADPDDPVAGQRCAGLLTRACLGHDEPEVPRLRQPEGRNGHPRGCAPIEAALWEEWLERWNVEALQNLPVPAREALRRSQQAWTAFRDTSCRVEAMIHPGFYGRDLAAECQREAVTARALELRRIATAAREARR